LLEGSKRGLRKFNGRGGGGAHKMGQRVRKKGG
jgi:hypothetical protein